MMEMILFILLAVVGTRRWFYHFLEHGADINDRNHDDDTPLHFASSFGNRLVALLLLKLGADINARNKDENTLLHFATAMQRRERFDCRWIIRE